MASPKVVILTDDNFEEEVLKSDKKVLVDFWAEWCGPCLMLGPKIDELAEEVDSTCKVCKLNVDQNLTTSRKYNVMSIPTLIFFKDGQAKHTMVGAQPKDLLKSKLASL